MEVKPTLEKLSNGFELLRVCIRFRVPRGKGKEFKTHLGLIEIGNKYGKARMETIPGKDYILLPLWTADPPLSQSLKSSPNAGFKPSGDDEKKVNEEPRKECGDPKVNVVGAKTSIELLDDPNMPELEDIVYSDDYKDVGAEADMNNLNTFIPVSPIPTTRIHKDHPVEQIIGDLNSAPQTRRMTKNLEEHDLFCFVRQRTNHKEFQNCLFACFLAQEEPKKVIHALKDPSWIEAMQDELLQFKLQEMDVKSAFLYGKIEEEVYVCQPPGFEDPDFLDKVYKVEKALYGLHQAPKACARYPIQSKGSLSHVVKRIFRYLKGQPKLGLSYSRDSTFDLVAYTDSDYAGESLDRKSTTRGCQFLRSRLISWQCKKQTVAIVKAKTVNGEVQLQALVDGKKIIITEASVRSDLQLDDEEGGVLGANKPGGYQLLRLGINGIMYNFTIKSFLPLETTKTNQATEIASLKKRFKKLERRIKLRTHGLKTLYKVSSSRRVESSDEECLGKEDVTPPNSGSSGIITIGCNDHELKIIGIRSIMVKMHGGTVHTIRDVRHETEASVASHSLIHRVAVTWHQKLGHMSKQGMKILMERKLLPGLIKVYPIKKKSDVFEVFKVYKARVELDSGKKIKCLRTNNGGEYTSDEFDTFCRQEGIKIDLRHDRDEAGKNRGTTKETTSTQIEKEFQSNDSFKVAPQHEVNETNESQAPATRTLNHERRRRGWHSDYVMESTLIIVSYRGLENITLMIQQFRVVLATCATYDLHLEQLDVKTAFLHGNLEGEIYMLQSEDEFSAVKKRGMMRSVLPVCTSASRNHSFHAKTTASFEFREKVEEGTVDMQKIHTDDNVAD
ncbi:putative ribonuclease H-like domain-containing protein [Tanacetum coccineum]|uniref:Ribonuclease H-like domain-containing protein n=1 Tax=Tanacetum coccineum TaxID=301880 RepID=A0ABQ5JCH7_9ASTR